MATGKNVSGNAVAAYGSGGGKGGSGKASASGTSGKTAESLTGVGAQERYRITEGLKKDQDKYKSILGGEDDDLFKMVTNAYYSTAYPIIFIEQDDKK